MKIEKGKLYLDTESNTLFKADFDSDNYGGFANDKIAVHCFTERDWDYVKSKGYELRRFIGSSIYTLNGFNYYDFKNFDIKIDQFKDFYPPGVEHDPYVWGDKIVVSNKKDDIVYNNGLREASDIIRKKLSEEVFNPQPHYDNSRGSLYKVATERGWNAYLFDLVKRLERGGKKDPLRQEIEKSIDVLKIWLNEID